MTSKVTFLMTRANQWTTIYLDTLGKMVFAEIGIISLFLFFFSFIKLAMRKQDLRVMFVRSV